MIEFKITEKAQFTITGIRRTFNDKNAYAEIPEFWQEVLQNKECKLLGEFGFCVKTGKDEFDYYIADNYNPFKDLTKGYDTKVIPGGTWAVFPCRGELPKSVQDLNTKIRSEWLPSCKKYAVAGDYDLEAYFGDENYCEIWIPVKKV